MKIFVTGTTGFIGGSLGQRLVTNKHQVYGLVRSESKARQLEQAGIRPIIGTLDDAAVLTEAAHHADAIIDAASADHPGSVQTFIKALTGSEKPFIHTSGSSIVCDDARGESENPTTYHDDSYIQPTPIREARVAIDRSVRFAGISHGIRTVVICPTMIYGTGRGLQKDSDQIPKLIRRSKERGAGVYIGKGLNRWSNVYIDDLVDLYLLALEKAPSGSFFFAENGEETFKRIAYAVSQALGFQGKTESWNADDAIAQYGDWARFALASNSRVRSVNARRLLGWSPKGPSLIEALESGEAL
ncbi:MAG: NAD-dependent epimerase/dehydratase family protein [Acidobacteriaceae bacterium]